jgi:hypothetical protein
MAVGRTYRRNCRLAWMVWYMTNCRQASHTCHGCCAPAEGNPHQETHKCCACASWTPQRRGTMSTVVHPHTPEPSPPPSPPSPPCSPSPPSPAPAHLQVQRHQPHPGRQRLPRQPIHLPRTGRIPHAAGKPQQRPPAGAWAGCSIGCRNPCGPSRCCCRCCGCGDGRGAQEAAGQQAAAAQAGPSCAAIRRYHITGAVCPAGPAAALCTVTCAATAVEWGTGQRLGGHFTQPACGGARCVCCCSWNVVMGAAGACTAGWQCSRCCRSCFCSCGCQRARQALPCHG